MKSRLCFAKLTLLGLMLAQPAVGQPAAGAAVVSPRDAMKNSVARLAIQGRYPLSQFFRLSIADGVFSGELLAELPAQTALQRVEVEGSEAVWTVRTQMAGVANPTQYLMIYRYDFDAPADQFWSTSISLRAGYVTLYGTTGDNKSGLRVRLTQSNGTLSFTCSTINQGAVQTNFLASAQSMRQLHAEHPQEVRQYLVPLLRNLTGRSLLRPGASDVYRLFESIPADPAVMKKLDGLLVKLESDSYAVREQASKDLAATGPAYVLAALRRDPSDLSGEARNRLDQFISKHSNAPLEDLAAARKDRSLLLDCLDDDDPAVRAASKAQIEKIMGQKIEFDVSLSGDARAEAVDGLRRKFDPQTRSGVRRATTRPSAR